MKISLIVLAALTASLLLRHRSAAVRHWVLAAAIACAAALPALETLLPVWTLPFAAPTAFEKYDAAPAISVVSASRSPNVPAVASVRNRQPEPIAPAGLLNATTLLQALWVAGTAVSLSILLVGILRLTWVAAHAHRVTRGRWSDLAAEISRVYGLRRPVTLLQSDHPSLLVTWGLTEPKVILPAAADAWPDERARVVLTHELAHIKRGDWLVQLSAELLRAVYWFNPLLWIACRRLRLESEHACDDEVMNRGVGGSDYASHLIELARALNHRRLWFPAPAMARSSSLERRVRAMLNDRLNRTPITGTTRAAIFAALLAMTAAVAAAQSGFVTFTGAVVDQKGRGIPGAALILTNEPRQAKYEVKTNDAGRFEFIGLPAGEYGLEIKGIGFQLLREPLTIGGQNLQRQFMMKLGTLQETINVSVPIAADDTPQGSAAPRVREVPMPARRECAAPAVGGQIVPPKKIRDVWPVYPSALRGTGTEGTVQMEGIIGLDGYVGDIKIMGDAHPELAQSAIAAVREWRYTETLLNCEPVEVMMTITTNFKVAPPPPPPPPAR